MHEIATCWSMLPTFLWCLATFFLFFMAENMAGSVPTHNRRLHGKVQHVSSNLSDGCSGLRRQMWQFHPTNGLWCSRWGWVKTYFSDILGNLFGINIHEPALLGYLDTRVLTHNQIRRCKWCVYIYMLAPPRSSKIYLIDAFPETYCTSTNYAVSLIMQILYALQRRSIPTTYTVEHSSKHAAFFSEEVQFPLRKLFSLRSIIQYFFQNTRFLLNMQCMINIEYCCENVQWLMLITAFLEKKYCC